MGFQLGLFSPNTESGLAITTVPERWRATWDNNLRLARLADESGIDFLLPVARWTDWGPRTDFHQSVLDPLVWASGMLAGTERLRVFTTVHTAFHHPIVAAKQLATADHLSRGRVGLNIVTAVKRTAGDTGVILQTIPNSLAYHLAAAGAFKSTAS